MAKRDIEDEPMDEELVEADVPTVGERLKAAREEKGLSLEDIAAQTRIPQRHLESIESRRLGEASRADLHRRFRQELCFGGRARPDRDRRPASRGDGRPALRFLAGGSDRGRRPGADHAQMARDCRGHRGHRHRRADELAQPPLARAAGAGVQRRDAAPAATQPRPPPSSAATPAPAAAQGPVVLMRSSPRGSRSPTRARPCSRACLQPGQTFAVPPTATAPMLKAGKPEALRVTVGSAVAPPVGPPGKVASKVSLKGPDLMRGGSCAAPAPPRPQPARGAQ